VRRALVIVALAAAFAGCGGEDPMSPEDYRAELRKICAESERKTDQVEQPTRATPEAIADYLTRLRDISVTAVEKVEELEPPDDLADAHDRALDANREGIEKVEPVIDELEKGGDPTQILAEARNELKASGEAAKKAGDDLGVPECGD
jgi:hypothetical protein